VSIKSLKSAENEKVLEHVKWVDDCIEGLIIDLL